MRGNNVDDFDFTSRKIFYKAMIICASKTNISGDIYVKLTQSTDRKSTCLTVPDN